MPNRKGRRTKPQRLERVYGLFECHRCKHRWGEDVLRYERTHEVLSPAKCKRCGEMDFPHTTEPQLQVSRNRSRSRRGGLCYNPSSRPDHHFYSSGSDSEHHYDDIYEDRQQPKHNMKLDRPNDGDECHQPRKRGAKRNKDYNYD